MKKFLIDMLSNSSDVSSKRTFAFALLIVLILESISNIFWQMRFDILIHNDLVNMFLFLTGYSTIEKFKPTNQQK